MTEVRKAYNRKRQVRTLFQCRRCKATTEGKVILHQVNPAYEDYLELSHYHECSSGKWGVMEFKGFDKDSEQ